jgi:HTH-type transcriptional regulator/antitoxin HigA
MTQESILLAVRNERDYAAALDELDALVLAEPGTPPGRRFDELVRLIDEYTARCSGNPLSRRQGELPRGSVVPLQERIGKSRQVLQRSPG